MSPERWEEIEKLYHAALERQPVERSAFLDQCADEDVRREVQSLLAHEQSGDRILEDSLCKPRFGPSLAVGTRLGYYEILSLIGAGGMGEVYRARDTKLGREVALKVLPEAFVQDADRMARLGREARVLASLNHPHVAMIYGLEESEGIRALVMELVEGPTLADRIGKRAMTLGEALPIAKQIAEALEYAHERGIIHRDLKPANVKLTADGNVKLLDFGLAKALEAPVGSDQFVPPTVTMEPTRAGVILGTAPYMSPEQAQGKPADRRADIWAFGVVLYEMLTGQQLYTGDSSSEILACVIKDTPNLNGLPVEIRYLAVRCLRKDPRQRWQSIGDVRIAIEEASEAKNTTLRNGRPGRFNLVLGFGIAAVLLLAFTVIGFWFSRRSVPGKLPLTVPITSGIGFADSPSFSPDGKQIAYSWRTQDDPTSSIYVKLIGGETDLRITTSPGQDTVPAWSPDGRYIAFYRDVPRHAGYYVVSALGGPVRQILTVTTAWSAGWVAPGDAWFPDGRFVAVVLPSGIVSVNLETGEKKQLTDVKDALDDISPAISPDGKTLAFTRWRALESADIYISSASGGPARRLTNFGTDIFGLTWTPDSRDLVFAMYRDGVNGLWRMTTTGEAARPITSGTEDLSAPTLARQGDQLAYVVSAGRTSIWRTDISQTDPPRASGSVRLISSVRYDNQPMYSRDGRKIAFESGRSGPGEIWEVDAEGQAAVRLTHVGGPNNGTPRWSPDGSAIVFDSRSQGNPEILVVTEEGRKVRRVTNNPAEDVTPNWSADGRWIYFASNRNGEFQIYRIRSDQSESPTNLPVQVTTQGGFNALESPDGEYLYFARSRDDKPGLWRRRVNAAASVRDEPVLETLQNWGWWALGPEGVFFLEADGSLPTSKVLLKYLDLRSKRISDLKTLEYPTNSSDAPLTVSPDGRRVLYEQDENQGSNIVMIENFR